MTVKSDDKTKVLTFGDFVVAAYEAWGRRRANELVRRAVNTHLVQFQGGQRVLISGG